AVSASRSHTPGFERDLVRRALRFYAEETYLATGVGTPEQTLTKIDVPDSANVGLHREWMLVRLRDDWTVDGTTYRAGSLLATGFDAFMAGSRDLTVLFEPTATTSLAGVTWTRRPLVLNVLDDVKNLVHVLTPPAGGPAAGGTWTRGDLPLGGELQIGRASCRVVACVALLV